ncbi:MAG: DUF4007 family protein [Eubacterium sp.]|nr:DUF4007 family protein [Eubacterium sp.]
MKFRAHETFPIRKGWLSKGLKNIRETPDVFVSKEENPMDVLGIGANMVKALRYWLQATNLTTEPQSGRRDQSITPLGKIIYDNDPYFEEIGSLWLVHYALATNEDNATSWYLFFNEFNALEFNEDDFYRSLRKYIMIRDEKMPSARVISDDFKCVINTYYAGKRGEIPDFDPESNLECPLTELGLIDYVTAVQGNRIYRKTPPKAENIPSLIILALILATHTGEKEIKISSLTNEKNSVGKVFNIDMITMLNVLYEIEKMEYIKIIRTAGLDVINVLTDMTFEDSVKKYYDELNSERG